MPERKDNSGYPEPATEPWPRGITGNLPKNRARKNAIEVQEIIETEATQGGVEVGDPATAMKKAEEIGTEQEYAHLDTIWLGTGTNRSAFALRPGLTTEGVPIAFKVAHGRNGRKDNEKEVTVWQIASNEAKGLLAPLNDYTQDFSVVFMAQAEDPEATSREKKRATNSLQSKAVDVGLEPDDIHSKNIGVIRDRSVVVDYGGFGGR